jgi:hypothetical protein
VFDKRDNRWPNLSNIPWRHPFQKLYNIFLVNKGEVLKFLRGVFMLHIKSKKISLLLCSCVISWLLSPAPAYADEVNSWGGDSGSIDAGKAAVQRAAAVKRAAKKQKKAEEKKATETQKESNVQKEKTVTK